jgi:hypothetical protein
MKGAGGSLRQAQAMAAQKRSTPGHKQDSMEINHWMLQFEECRALLEAESSLVEQSFQVTGGVLGQAELRQLGCAFDRTQVDEYEVRLANRLADISIEASQQYLDIQRGWREHRFPGLHRDWFVTNLHYAIPRNKAQLV